MNNKPDTSYLILKTSNSNLSWVRFQFVVKWPVPVKKIDDNANSYYVNIREEVFESYEEAKRYKSQLLESFINIRSTIPPSSITIEILE